jgi:hypothetical protein
MNGVSRPDPLLKTLARDSRTRADRLHYATGELLGADDFSVEQTYHRRQLARALLLLHGSGTIAGLRVDLKLQVNPDDPGALDEVELVVQPGLAIDRAGRLIEVARPHCLRLKRWFQYLAAAVPDFTPQNEDDQDDLKKAFHPDSGQVIADVFLRFHECEGSPSPAFATGPFDALDASQPSRTRDAHELKLVLRPEPSADLNDETKAGRAFDPWQGVLATAQSNPGNDNLLKVLQAASLAGWDAHEVPNEPAAVPSREYPARFDPTAVLLARIRIPATRSNPGEVPIPTFSAAAWGIPAVRPDNLIRNFIYAPALALRLGISFNP